MKNDYQSQDEVGEYQTYEEIPDVVLGMHLMQDGTMKVFSPGKGVKKYASSTSQSHLS
jgi:hypothetical protein